MRQIREWEESNCLIVFTCAFISTKKARKTKGGG